MNEARKPFRFFNYLTEHQDFLPTVARVWSTTQPIYHSRTALSRFHAKLKLLKYDMRLLNKIHYGDLPVRTKQAFEEMCHCQNMVLQNPTSVNVAAAADASDHWNKLASIEEKFYRQNSCIRWLGAGDHNSVFFFIVRCRPGLRGIQLNSLSQRPAKPSRNSQILRERLFCIFRDSFKLMTKVLMRIQPLYYTSC